MRTGRMRNGLCWSATRLGAWTVVGCVGGLSPGASGASGSRRRCSRLPRAAWRVPLGCCAATACGLPIRPVLKHGPRSLTCVRVDGLQNLRCARKLMSGRPSWPHRWPTLIFCEGFELEHACRDPKDGELCLSGAKPEETLVEARSDTDVQIVRLTWV